MKIKSPENIPSEMKSPKKIPRRDFIKNVLSNLAGLAVVGNLGERWMDRHIEKAFEDQKKWTLEYISSPKYRERIKRSLARGFFEKEKANLTKEEIDALKTKKLEQLYPTDIDTSGVSEDLVDEIIKKRIDNVKDTRMGIATSVANFTKSSEAYAGMYVPQENKKSIMHDHDHNLSTSTHDAIAQGKNILLDRIAFISSGGSTTVPAHELSHASTDGDRNLESRFKTLTSNRINFNYYDNASEVKARLDALRYELQKSGVYDPNHEDFNWSHVEKMRNLPSFKGDSESFIELIKKIEQDKGDDLIWYMNNIADVGNGISTSPGELVSFLGRTIGPEDVAIVNV